MEFGLSELPKQVRTEELGILTRTRGHYHMLVGTPHPIFSLVRPSSSHPSSHLISTPPHKLQGWAYFVFALCVAAYLALLVYLLVGPDR